ncbi:MAG: IS21 family transposase [Bacillota bacterium]
MIAINIYEQIRYLFAVKKLSQRKIARELGISRNTVKRYCQGENVPWESKSRQYQRPVTEPIEDIVKEWLASDQDAPLKQRHTAERIYQRLVEEHGFTGSASTVRKLVKELRPESRQAHVPLEFDPGEAAQVDWGEATVYVAGRKSKVQIFCFRLCYSCAPYVAAFPSQRNECFLAGHVQAFNFFGGVTRRLICDNVKTAVKEGWGCYVKAEQPAFIALKSHYAFSADFCNPRAGNEKGLVEDLVGFARRNFFVPVPRVENLTELQPELDKRCIQYKNRHLRYHPAPVKEALAAEQKNMTPLPAREFDYAVTSLAEVDTLSLVKFDRNRYSVPVNLVGKTVTVKGYPLAVKIYHGSRQVAVHPRSYLQGQTRLELEHYLPSLIKKPRSLKNAAPLRRAVLPPGLNTLKQDLLARGEDKELARVLGLVLEYGIDETEKAIGLALQSGQHSYQAIRYYLTRRESAPAILPELYRVEPVGLEQYDRLWAGERR